jgi:acyl carrier protein
MKFISYDIIGFLKNELNVVEAIEGETALFSTGLLDSVAMLNLIGFLEDQFKIEVRASDVTLENFDTPEQIEAYVNSRR